MVVVVVVEVVVAVAVEAVVAVAVAVEALFAEGAVISSNSSECSSSISSSSRTAPPPLAYSTPTLLPGAIPSNRDDHMRGTVKRNVALLRLTDLCI